MDDRSSANIRLLTLARCSGAAAVLGAVLLITATVIFTLTHGTQTEAQNGTLFGLRSAQYSKIFQPTIWLAFLLGVVGVNALQAGRARRLGKAGFMISSAAAVGISNFLEDALGIEWLGYIWVLGLLNNYTNPEFQASS